MKNGFSLVELLVALGILGGVLAAVNGIFFMVIKSGQKADVYIRLKENGQYALNFMSYKIRDADSILSACPGTGASIRIREHSAGTLTFSLAGGRLSVAAPAVNYLTSSEFTAQNLVFNCAAPLNAPKRVTISFTLSRPPPATETQTFQTTVSLRNY